MWTQTGKELLLGAARLRRPRSGVAVLYYHGVVERKTDALLERNFASLETFVEQVRLLRHFEPVSLAELQGGILDRRPLPRRGVAITFDDGYANNMLACELLRPAHRSPAIFITTGAVDSQRPIWTAELSLLLLHGAAERIEVAGQVWCLRSRADRERAFAVVRPRLKRIPAGERRAAMSELRDQFPAGETERLVERFPAFRMLNWAAVRQLAADGAEIGGHGVEHEIHHGAQEPGVRKSELGESRARIEQQLHVACRWFAYPNGTWCAASPDEAGNAGYELGLTTARGCPEPGHSPFLLPRISAGNSVRGLVRDLLWRPFGKKAV